jgi:hypothetical protein
MIPFHDVLPFFLDSALPPFKVRQAYAAAAAAEDGHPSAALYEGGTLLPPAEKSILRNLRKVLQKVQDAAHALFFKCATEDQREDYFFAKVPTDWPFSY